MRRLIEYDVPRTLGGARIYAIVETGGKQYRVTPGQVLDVDLLDVAEGDAVELERVLVLGDGDKVTLGTPTVDGAKVVATSNGDGRAAKIIVFRYKPKTRYKRKTGHRQGFTRLTIDRIDGPGVAANKPARRKKKEVDDSGA